MLSWLLLSSTRFHVFTASVFVASRVVHKLMDEENQLLEAAKEGCRGDLLDLLSEGADIEHKGEVRHGT